MEFQPQQRSADGRITYPPGVKEITDKISNDEVVKRLKMVVKTFMDMDQDSEDEKQQYLALALHLASEFFLRNPNKDVRLLVACCLADIFRIYAPEAPYTSHDKLKDIFLFITRQLKGLEDTKSPQFNRYFYLLENLAWVKSYNICFELEDCNEIFIQLFKTLFSVINTSHNQKVHMHMLDLMSSIITEGDGVTQELLDTILINLIPAHKNLNKQAYDLAKILLKRTVQTIETCIANFFNQVLVLSKSSVSDLSEHVFDLIQELFAIDPHLLVSVMPQLEFKLKSNDGEERLAVVRLLAKLFGAKDSELASHNRPLWQCFLGRFNDIHVPVRLECVKFASHCLMNHPDLAKDLTDFLKVRSHDPEEAIRHDVIVTIINAGKKDLILVNDQLLGFVRERTLDKRWRVRKEAMMGLAQLYKKYCLHHEAGKESALKISWIKDKLLHIYYQNSIDDKLLVEKIFAQFMVPHNLETEEKMKCLYYLYACLDPNAVKALNEMWKCQNMLRSHVRELLDLHKQPTTEANTAAMFGKLITISKNLPDPGKAQDFLKKFNQVLGEDEKLRSQLELLISPTCSCKQAEICVVSASVCKQRVTLPRCLCLCLWFMLEVLMTKNENNSHAFLRKMVENIKQTKDAQAPDDPKVNEKLYTVCDVALLVIANKSTACHLESPKDPLLPSKFFTAPDKDFVNDKEYVSSEARTALLTGKPKPSPVLVTVNKPLSVTGRRPYTKSTAADGGAGGIGGGLEPSSPAGNKGRDGNAEGLETGASENNENPGIILSDSSGKDANLEGSQGGKIGSTPTASPTPPAVPSKPRRGRPPKSLSGGTGTPPSAEKEGGATGRGRKRAAPAQDGTATVEPITIKIPKQQKDTESKRTAPQRQMDLQSHCHLLGSEGDTEMESSSGSSRESSSGRRGPAFCSQVRRMCRPTRRKWRIAPPRCGTLSGGPWSRTAAAGSCISPLMCFWPPDGTTQHRHTLKTACEAPADKARFLHHERPEERVRGEPSGKSSG
nr:sister chromatid cohesion protein PDS5 homolog A-like [Paramormyrops kingsleyae]